jgi:hypothetical protein
MQVDARTREVLYWLVCGILVALIIFVIAASVPE